jgi:hypothetical protein
MTIHIPDEVIEAAAKAVCEAQGYIWDRHPDFCPHWRGEARAALTAALQAWPGMHQKNIKGSLYYDGDHSIVLPIIRTEPRT